MTTDWFRNTTWNDSIERAFEEKLRRARDKSQYLKIQACTLESTHPDIALRLLDRYFELSDRYFDAPAHVGRAKAFLALGRINDALDSYEAALAAEAKHPGFLTGAYVELPYFIATLGVRERYDRAIQLLLEYEHKRLAFPLQRFWWHTARAIIAADRDENPLAKIHANLALEAAAQQHSGFRYHPNVGIVSKKDDRVIRTLKTIRKS